MQFNKTIYVDVDNTIMASEHRLCELYNREYKTPLEDAMNPDEVTTWDMGIDSDIVEEIFSRIDFYNSKQVRLYDNVVEVLSKLKRRGYTIIIYSKGSLLNIASKSMFLDTLLGDIIDGHVFIGSNTVTMGKSMLDMEGSIILDDHIKNLTGNNTMYNICAKLTTLEADWNKDFKEDLSKGNFVMHSWSELPKIIDMIEMIT